MLQGSRREKKLASDKRAEEAKANAAATMTSTLQIPSLEAQVTLRSALWGTSKMDQSHPAVRAVLQVHPLCLLLLLRSDIPSYTHTRTPYDS